MAEGSVLWLVISFLLPPIALFVLFIIFVILVSIIFPKKKNAPQTHIIRDKLQISRLFPKIHDRIPQINIEIVPGNALQMSENVAVDYAIDMLMKSTGTLAVLKVSGRELERYMIGYTDSVLRSGKENSANTGTVVKMVAMYTDKNRRTYLVAYQAGGTPVTVDGKEYVIYKENVPFEEVEDTLLSQIG